MIPLSRLACAHSLFRLFLVPTSFFLANMRRLSSALVTFALIAQPLAVAAFYETPGAILQAVRFDASAKMFSAEVHGSNGTTYVSAWMNGKMEGTEYPEAKLSAQVTVDVADTESHMKGRFKGAIMILDGQLYAKLDSMEGTFEDDVLLGTVRLATKKWINFPVDADMVEEIQNAIHQTGDPAEADDHFTMVRTPYQYGSSYTLTMNPEDEEITSLQIKVDTDYKDAVQVSKVTFEGTAGDFAITGQAKAERMKTPLTLTAPADSVSFEWLMDHLSAINPDDIFNGSDAFEEDIWSEDEEGDDEWVDIEDDEDMPMDDEDNVPGQVESHPTLRRTIRENRSVSPVDRVHSGIKKPSRRMLKMGANE
jgi:hypothetical protein